MNNKDRKLYFHKKYNTDKIYWVENYDTRGEFLYSFDKKIIHNFFDDYPNDLTKEEKELFDKENPMLAALFRR